MCSMISYLASLRPGFPVRKIQDNRGFCCSWPSQENRQSSQKSGTRRENRNTPDFPSCSRPSQMIGMSMISCFQKSAKSGTVGKQRNPLSSGIFPTYENQALAWCLFLLCGNHLLWLTWDITMVMMATLMSSMPSPLLAVVRQLLLPP